MGNPVRFVDPDGRGWKATSDENGNPTGYSWVDPSESYDENGCLKEGIYEQAIFFSNGGEEGNYSSASKYNIGTSTATVYKSDGTTETYNACTFPSDNTNYATVPEGVYEAKVGLHKGKYTALRLSDEGTSDFNNNSIELYAPNPSNPRTTKARGINIHKPGLRNFTAIDSKNRAISQGCLLIDRNSWDDFIGIFDNANQKNNVISVSVSRCLSAPTNTQWHYSSFPLIPIFICQPDALRVNINIIR